MAAQKTRHINTSALESPPDSHPRSERIYILGVGNLGILFAHALSQTLIAPPITLLLHRPGLLEDWESGGQKITITTNGVPSTSSAYSVELVKPESGDVIRNLIVATKAVQTASALRFVKHRLTRESTVLFAQNGMGTMDEVTSDIFSDEQARPRYLTCITSHGVYSQGSFRSVHAGLAHVTIGQVSTSPAAPRYLIDQIVSAPILTAREVDPAELLRLQLEKLVVNAMINPLTAIFNCQNGMLFNREPITRLMRLLLQETSLVVLSLPALCSDPSTASRFSTQSLETVILDVAAKTAQNTSSMLQDVRAGRKTEIDYINGYIVRKGQEQGVECRHNEELVRMIKEGVVIGFDEIESHFPHYE
jgi:2-dehydropantoate 2-reductase